MTYRIIEDLEGVGAIAEDVADAYEALGHLHGQFRPLQSRLLHTAGAGRLQERVLALPPLSALDELTHRLDIPNQAKRGAAKVDSQTKSWIDGYCRGFGRGLKNASVAERALSAPFLLPDLETMLAGLLLSSYLGLAQGQERMERALIEAVAQGGDVELLRFMHAPNLDVVDASRLAALPRTSSTGHTARHFLWAGGSNAWAVGPEHTVNGRPILCGDPHLQVNQLPSLFFETRIRLRDNYWLGASIPGLAGMAIARTRHVAWSGTFSVADNVDWFTIEGNDQPFKQRQATIKRRGRKPISLSFSEVHSSADAADPKGVVEAVQAGTALAVAWAGGVAPEQTMQAYTRLPLCESAREVVREMDDALTLSLHFVIADSAGDVWYRQVGRIPKRAKVDLAPKFGGPGWERLYRGDELPREQASLIASANEARLGMDAAVLSTFAQPDYRWRRIESLLRAQKHDVHSMQRLQLDTFSPQAQRLRPLFLSALAEHPLAELIAQWDLCYNVDSVGAVAFERLYSAARDVVARRIGGDWMLWMMRHSELPLWWCRAIDEVLARAEMASDPQIVAALRGVKDVARPQLADVQRFSQPHLLLGKAPFASRGERPLPGSRATIRQGSQIRVDGGDISIAPAFRFITDFAEDAAFCALPGGIDGAPLSGSYGVWLEAWHAGEYRKITPPRG